MPPGCNDDGTAKKLTRVSSGDPVIPAGDRRFA